MPSPSKLHYVRPIPHPHVKKGSLKFTGPLKGTVTGLFFNAKARCRTSSVFPPGEGKTVTFHSSGGVPWRSPRSLEKKNYKYTGIRITVQFNQLCTHHHQLEWKNPGIYILSSLLHTPTSISN